MFTARAAVGRLGALLVAHLIIAEAAANPLQPTKLPIRGIVRPVHQAAISVDLPVRVTKLHFREAQAFKKGDVLVTLDCERLTAEQAAMEAVHREMRLVLESNTYLDRRGAIGKVEVEVSRARVDKAKAEAQALAARLRQCTVTAPFDGRIAELKINEHEIPASGQPFISIVDETTFEIDLIVPSAWLKSLVAGTTFKFIVDETGLSYTAQVLRIGAAVDPVSQTVKLIAAFAHRDGRVLAGMSGTATFPELAAAR